MAYDTVTTRDQLGRPEDKGFFIKKSKEEIFVEEGPTIVQTRDVSSDFIWGRDEWSSDGTYEWDLEKDNDPITVRVVNPNNLFRERLVTDDFYDSASSTNTTWDTSSREISFSAAGDCITKSVALNLETYLRATLTVTGTNLSSTSDIRFYLSVDGGSHWEEVTNGTEHVFTNSAVNSDIRVKFAAQNTNPTITYFQVGYGG